jgi:hypothetical protein
MAVEAATLERVEAAAVEAGVVAAVAVAAEVERAEAVAAEAASALAAVADAVPVAGPRRSERTAKRKRQEALAAQAEPGVT